MYVIQPTKIDFVKGTGLFVQFWHVKEASSAETALLSRRTKKFGEE